MTTVPAPTAPPPTTPTPTGVTSPLRVAGAIAQMAALAIIGPVLFTILITLLSVGIGLIPILGIGLVILLAGVYVLYAMSWLEHARVEGLYDFGLALPLPRRSGRPGFGGFLRTVWQQFIDGSTWRGIANLAISTILGFVVLALIGAFASGIVLAFAPLFANTDDIRLFGTGLTVPLGWGVGIGIVQVLVGAAGTVGLGILHGVLSRAVLVPSQEAQLAAAARASSAQRDGAVRAADVERTRIERDLHDGVQPRLVSVGMTLGLAQQKIESDPNAAKELISEAHTSTKAAITELRQLARGIHASVLDDRGLDAALSALAARSHTPVHLDVRLDGRCSRDAEAAVYFAIAEALTNAAKHARAGSARVVVRLRDRNTLWARVEDDGIGGATIVPGGGLDGIMNRVLAAGGQARLDSPQGGPTSLEVSVPCAS
ncbi:MAG: histidine kinase [Gemmatimonadota bacterium]|nr:histidine kinase [Gemmatimonadota bacterium]